MRCGETSPDISDLVERDGIHYKKFSDVLFTGKFTGKEQGSFRKGEKDGSWVSFNEDGTVYQTGTRRTSR